MNSPCLNGEQKMNISLVRYNISYYIKTLRFIAPLLVFIVFFFIHHQTTNTPIWSSYYISAVAIFILSNWIGTSFINSEDTTQQFITRLHVKNENIYHVSKIISILLLIMPFYILLVFYPILTSFFARNLTTIEVLVALIINFLFSLMGTSISIFFNTDLHNQKNNTLPLQALVILITVIPISMIFENNTFVRFATYFLPPVNFFAGRLHYLNDEIFMVDYRFMLFILYSLGYSLALIVIYILLIRKKK